MDSAIDTASGIAIVMEDKKAIRPHWRHCVVVLEQDTFILAYTTLTNFSTKYLVMCKVYTNIGGIK